MCTIGLTWAVGRDFLALLESGDRHPHSESPCGRSFGATVLDPQSLAMVRDCYRQPCPYRLAGRGIVGMRALAFTRTTGRTTFTESPVRLWSSEAPHVSRTIRGIGSMGCKLAPRGPVRTAEQRLSRTIRCMWSTKWTTPAFRVPRARSRRLEPSSAHNTLATQHAENC